MKTNFKADRTQDAWRDFAIGLVLFLVALRLFQPVPWRAPTTSLAIQALLVPGAVFAHAILHRFGRFTEVTRTVVSFGRVSALRLSVVGVAVLMLMFSVWRIAEIMGGAIETPLPWGPGILDHRVFPVGYGIAISFYLVVTAPIIEELCFRGWMQRGLARRFNPTITIFTPALLFAVLHASMYSHPGYLVIPLALGLTLGLVAERSRSLWPSVIMHSLWNITMVAIAARNAERPLSWRAPQDAFDVIVVLAGISLSGIALLRLLPRTDHSADRASSKLVLDTQEAA